MGSGKIKVLKSENITAEVAVISHENLYNKSYYQEDSIEVRDLRGNSVIMNAVKEEESGEMIATDNLNEIVVAATFRNVAERNGKVDIAFEIRVPPKMQDPLWQVRFKPRFKISEDTLYSDEIHITGAKYRAEQLRGYELYKRYLRSIIPDSSDFIASFCYEKLLDRFINRKLKGKDGWENDTVVRKEVIEYYTKAWLVSLNNRRKSKKEFMYNKYIKSPIITDGIRLDSVITSVDGTIRYHYIQTINAVKGLRKVDMSLSGGIFISDKQVYVMPQTSPLTYYISSISAFTDSTVKYVRTIRERNLNVNTVAYIDFNVGESTVNEKLFNNESEINRIKDNITEILLNEDFIADSLVITASCSPEGSYAANLSLARSRALSIRKYFNDFISGDIDIIPRYIPEEWDRLENLINIDTNITNLSFLQSCFMISNPDNREREMQKSSDYKYIRRVLYPYLRTVKFDFFLHRKGMIKDTIHTTEVDTMYMNGLQALKERNYKQAVTLLKPYNDYNAAVAFVCMDYNKSALSILEELPKSAKRDYMLAVVYSRLGEEKRAVEFYMNSCAMEPAMKFRGNLDPEISHLIKKYNITN